MTRTFTDEELRDYFLRWRGVEDPCETCRGSGVRAYGSTATWRGGIGGAMVTSDVCDRCWGTGDKYRTGVDLKRLRGEEEQRIAERAVDALAHAAGTTLTTARVDVVKMADLLDRDANKRGSSLWYAELCRSLAKFLRRAALGEP